LEGKFKSLLLNELQAFFHVFAVKVRKIITHASSDFNNNNPQMFRFIRGILNLFVNLVDTYEK